MKKLFLMLLFIAGIGAAANAQKQAKSPDERAAHTTKSLQKMLNLTSDQANKVNAVLLSSYMRTDSLKMDSTGGKKSNHLSKKSIKITTEQQLMSIFNSDQQKQYMELQSMKKEHHHSKQAPAEPMPAATTPPVQG
jgi:hypothetical protein